MPLLRALELAEPRPREDASATAKKNYAERLSRQITQIVADALRGRFSGVLPDESGRGQESKARTSKGFKKLDVNYSTPELGLGLGVSIKTLNFRDHKSKNYRKNYTRLDNELRAEAQDYHDRQPFAVLVGLILLPMDACDDATEMSPSSFGLAVQFFRNRSMRQSPRDDGGLFERIIIGLYEHEGENRGNAVFFDVVDKPKKSGRPQRAFDFRELINRITLEYDERNNPPFEWDE